MTTKKDEAGTWIPDDPRNYSGSSLAASLVQSEGAMQTRLEPPAWNSCCVSLCQTLSIALWPALPLPTLEVSCTDSTTSAGAEVTLNLQ